MLKIPTRVRYAVKAMIDLAENYGQGPIMLRQVAERQEISESYLENLMVSLRVAGLVRAARGTRGGYSLTKAPSEMKLSHIIAALEGNLTLVDCVDDPELCYRSGFCVTRDVWADIEHAVFSVLDGVTLEDMVQRQRDKEQRLTMVAPGS